MLKLWLFSTIHLVLYLLFISLLSTKINKNNKLDTNILGSLSTSPTLFSEAEKLPYLCIISYYNNTPSVLLINISIYY